MEVRSNTRKVVMEFRGLYICLNLYILRQVEEGQIPEQLVEKKKSAEEGVVAMETEEEQMALMKKQQDEIDQLKAQLNEEIVQIPDPQQMAQSLSTTVSNARLFWWVKNVLWKLIKSEISPVL